MEKYGGREGQIRWPRGTNTRPSEIADLLKIADFLKISDFPEIAYLPGIAGLPKIVALPKIADFPRSADRPKFASQSHSLVYTFLVEPRFQRNRGKDRKGAIRSQETEEQEGLSYRKYINHIFIILRYFCSYPLYI